jgi:outer membrane lipoprotein-sorting protein
VLISASLFTLMAASRFGAQAPDLFDDLYARANAQRKTLKSVRATFSETTVSSLLTEPLVARGTLVAAEPSNVVMRYTAPEPRTITINPTRLIVDWPGKKREALDIKRTQERIRQYFVNADLNELRKLFEIRATLDSRPPAYQVEMRPKEKRIKQGVQRLVLWIDPTLLVMTQIRMEFPGGDSKTIRLEDVELNVPVDAGLFQAPK